MLRQSTKNFSQLPPQWYGIESWGVKAGAGTRPSRFWLILDFSPRVAPQLGPLGRLSRSAAAHAVLGRIGHFVRAARGLLC